MTGDLSVLRRKAFVLCWADDNVEFIRSRKMEICTLAALSSLQVSLSMSGLVLFDMKLLRFLFHMI